MQTGVEAVFVEGVVHPGASEGDTTLGLDFVHPTLCAHALAEIIVRHTAHG